MTEQLVNLPTQSPDETPTDGFSAAVPSPLQEPLPQQAAFEDLTLGMAISRFFRSPLSTLVALQRVVNTPPESASSYVVAAAPLVSMETAKTTRTPRPTLDTQSVRIIGFAAGLIVLFIVGVISSVNLQSERVRFAPDFPLSGVVLIGVGLVAAALTVMAGFGLPLARLAPLPDASEEVPTTPNVGAAAGVRLALLGVAILGSAGAWTLNGDNTFTTLGVFSWWSSILAWCAFFAPAGTNIGAAFGNLVQGVRRALSSPIRLRWSWVIAALVAILIVGGWFRLANLSAYLPDMTSDHVEKALDANKILNGDRSVFFPNNGGREVFQMYYLAVLHQITGIPISFELLKLGSGIEAMLTLLVAVWLGRAIFGPEQRRLGTLVGVCMAALLAVSYWHTMLSRLGLRIVLTPLITMIVLIFLARGLRHNRRIDFILAGLALGAGLYFYQAVRMVPVFVVTGIGLGLLIRVRGWKAFRQYAYNGIALIIVSAAVFVPLARYWSQYPAFFWERTGGRFFGEDQVNVLDASGAVIGQRPATPEDRAEAFRKNLPVFGDNFLKSLLMFNYRGDTAWITGDPSGPPQLDPYTGALFVIGVGVLIGRGVRRRDPVDWLLLVGIPILILPSALSIAFVIEVPSATRASGALPFVYLAAGVGMAYLILAVWERLQGRLLRGIVVGVAVLVVGVAATTNANRYFVEAMRDYRNSTFPYRQAGEMLRGFAESTGAPGNAFMIAWDYWWDHRALAIESGDPGWPNGILREEAITRIIEFMRFNMGTRFELRPDRQLMFFVHKDDDEMIRTLQTEFPNGVDLKITSFNRDKDFRVYVAPPPGCEWMLEKVGRVPKACEEARP